MSYSESLASRIRNLLASHRGVMEKRMFGGVGFLLRGNMLVGVWNTSLVVRVGPAAYAAALQQPEVREFDITGRPMKGWVLVGAEGLETEGQLQGWIEQAIEFVSQLPVK